MTAAALEVTGLSAGYDGYPVLEAVALRVQAGSAVALVGPNGAGKTTLARTLAGFTRVTAGRIVFEGEDVTGLSPRRRVARGIIQVPEGRRLFPHLSVLENIEMAFFARRRRLNADRRAALLEEALARFPVLRERRAQHAGTLSGGEQQMLAIARALLLEPRLLVLDEPSTGLAPLVRQEIFSMIRQVATDGGRACLLIEQRALEALGCVDFAYILERGRVLRGATPDQILQDKQLRATYVGT